MIDVWNQLYDFQKATVAKAYKFDKFLIGLDMGLGKTITSIALFNERLVSDHVHSNIVMVGKSKLSDWEKEYRKWLPNHKIVVFRNDAVKKKHKQLESLQREKNFILIVSHRAAYNLKDKFYEVFAHNNSLGRPVWNEKIMVTIDESQVMKSKSSLIGKWGMRLSKTVKYMTLLSGTPMSNGYEDLYTTLNMLGMIRTYAEFKDQFLVMGKKRMGHMAFEEVVGYQNVDTLVEILNQRATLIKTDEVHELPEQNIIDVDVDVPLEPIKKLMKERMWKEYEFVNAASLDMGVRQLSSGFIKGELFIHREKLEAVADILDSTNKPILIFYRFNGELDMLKHLMKEKRIKYYEVNGTIKQYEESKKETGDKYVILIQYQAGAKGLDYPDISYTIYYSPTPSGEDYTQSLKRTHRIGQQKACFYYRLIGKKTPERKQYDSLEKGIDYSDEMFLKDFSESLGIEVKEM